MEASGPQEAKAPGVAGAVAAKAGAYLEWCAQHPSATLDVIKRAAELGTELVQEAGTWKAAAASFREAWTGRFGNHMEELGSARLDGLVDADLLRFVRAMAAEGVRTRHRPLQARWRAKPHQSVMEHLEEAYQKVWKDAHKGRVLLCSAELQDELAGVLATPQGRVEKMSPDRTVSPEGRFVHDQRLVNALGSKYDHPLLCSRATVNWHALCCGGRRGCRGSKSGLRSGTWTALSSWSGFTWTTWACSRPSSPGNRWTCMGR